MPPSCPAPRSPEKVVLSRQSRILVTLGWPLVLCLMLSACSFLSPYDETTNDQIASLSVKTETFVASADSNRTPYSKAASFYSEAIGEVKAIRLRADLYDKNEEEIEALDRLEKRYELLRESHREGPITSSLAEPIRVSLRSLTQMQIAKKRSMTFSNNLRKKPSE